MKRILSLLLLTAVLLGAVACGSGNTAETASPAQTAVSNTETTETGSAETERGDMKSVVPDDIDLKGAKIVFGYVDSNRYRDDIIGDIEGDVVKEAVYKRNLNTEEKLKIKIDPLIVAASTQDAANKFQSSVVAGDHLMDINDGHQSYLSKFVLEGYFTNLYGAKYIDFDKPWWKTEYIDEFAVGTGTRYFLFGDLTLFMFRSAGCVYVNTQILEDQFMKLDELFTTVFDGKWTMDKFYEMTQKAYVDKNGNGTPDKGDQFGFLATTYKSVEHFQYDAGVRTTTRDKDGIPQLTLNNETTVRWAEKFYKMYYENPGAVIWTSDSYLHTDMLDYFLNSEVLFYPSWFYLAEYLGDMKDDYAIIPYPKLDETIDRYTTLVHNGSTMISVPITLPSDRLDAVSAVIEEMAYQSYVLVTPAYYEVALKAKYQRDSVSTQMVDLIWSTAFTDFGYCYSSTISGLGTLRKLANDKTPDFASYYASQETAAKDALKNLIDMYLKNTKK